jgi:hypothetical protein
MLNITELLREGKKDEIWDKICGFLDLGIDEFMEIQEKLLLEQLKRLGECELGSKIVGKKPPTSIEEFRDRVPLTNYDIYSKYLLEQREEVLPEKPYTWIHTSGRSGEYKYKWVPYTKRMYELVGECTIGFFILASCRWKGDIRLKDGDKIIYSLASPPYLSGLVMQVLADMFNFKIFPPIEQAIKMNFQERIQEGLLSSLSEGLDFFYGISSIMLKISDQFSHMSSGGRDKSEMKKLLRNPKVITKLLLAFIKSKLHKRNILPKDIWKLKGVMCGGTDTSVFKDKVKVLWGRTPYEAYGSTEFGMMATQSWNMDGLFFFPNNNFWEFIPEEDYYKMTEGKSYIPKTFLLNEVKPDQKYVVVGTNFHGGIMTRYMSGDMIKITALEEKETGIKLPQMVFSSRADDMIDIGSFTRLTEKTVWQSIEATGVGYADWTIRKEYKAKKPVLNLYIELKDDSGDIPSLEKQIHEALKDIDEPYKELETMAGIKPLKVTLLSKGTFKRYYEERQAAGADLAHLKPSHMNPPDKVIHSLLRMSSWQI